MRGESFFNCHLVNERKNAGFRGTFRFYLKYSSPFTYRVPTESDVGTFTWIVDCSARGEYRSLHFHSKLGLLLKCLGLPQPAVGMRSGNLWMLSSLSEIGNLFSSLVSFNRIYSINELAREMVQWSGSEYTVALIIQFCDFNYYIKLIIRNFVYHILIYYLNPQFTYRTPTLRIEKCASDVRSRYTQQLASAMLLL